MEIRNIKFNKHGGVDCEINHAIYGWIPFTASSSDVEPFGREIYEKCVGGEFGSIGEFVEPIIPEPTPEEIIADYEKELDDFLDGVARSYRYGINTALAPRYALIARAGYANADQLLAQTYGYWMDVCNGIAKSLLADVLAGNAEMPTLENFLAMFPAFEP